MLEMKKNGPFRYANLVAAKSWWAATCSAFGIVVTAALVLPGCAARPTAIHHGFSFGQPGANDGVQILDYQYGEERGLPARPSREAVASGRVVQGTDLIGTFPVAAFLYVKWKNLVDGRIYEKTVDLLSLLPRDMEDKTVYFAFPKQSLHVYVVSTKRLHAASAPRCPAKGYEIFECVTIFPINATTGADPEQRGQIRQSDRWTTGSDPAK